MHFSIGCTASAQYAFVWPHAAATRHNSRTRHEPLETIRTVSELIPMFLIPDFHVNQQKTNVKYVEVETRTTTTYKHGIFVVTTSNEQYYKQ